MQQRYKGAVNVIRKMKHHLSDFSVPLHCFEAAFTARDSCFVSLLLYHLFLSLNDSVEREGRGGGGRGLTYHQ